MSRLKSIARGLIGLAVAAYLIRLVVRSNNVDLTQIWGSADTLYLILGFFLLTAGTPIACYRWGLLMRVQEIYLSFWTILRLTMIGIFFNIVVPGGVGGDLLKMVYLRKEAGERTPEGVLTVLVDRILGLSGLLAVALVAVLMSWEMLNSGPPTLRLAMGVVGMGAAGGVACALGLFASPWLIGLGWVQSLVKFLKVRLPEKVVHLAERIFSAFFLYRDKPGVLLYSLGLSMVIHSIIGCAVACVGYAYGVGGVSISQFFLATMVANAVAAIPLTPGGLGGRDVVLSEFFKAYGVEESLAGLIPTVLSLLLVFWSLVGGLFFIFEKATPGDLPELAET